MPNIKLNGILINIMGGYLLWKAAVNHDCTN